MQKHFGNLRYRLTALIAICSGLWVSAAFAATAERSAPDLLPDSCVLYARMADPPALLNMILEHPLRADLEAHKAWQAATGHQAYRNFLTGRKFFEVQMGMDWRQAATALSSGGLHIAYDAKTQGTVLLVRGHDLAVMQKFQTGILDLVRLGKQAGKATDEYRGVTIYKLDQGGAAVVGEWLVVVNQGELGKFVLDSLLDTDTPNARSRAVLSGNPRFQQARDHAADSPTVWGFADLEVIRQADKVARALSGQAQNPFIEMLAGGIQSTLQKTPWVTAKIAAAPQSLGLHVDMPFSGEWIPEERQHFFGEEPEGHAPVLPQHNEAALTLATWRDVSEMWLRAGDLFDENTNDQLASADSTLTTLFAGRDFAEDILGSFRPQMGLVVVRQDFSDTLPRPAIRLPAFALVLEMREPEKMTRELRRTFQSMVGFFNVLGAMEGRPQLEMNMRQLQQGELVTSSYIPEEGDRESTSADLIFNFSPSIGFRDSRVVIASTQQLAEQLTTAEAGKAGAQAEPNTKLTLVAPVVQQILADNREQLIAQNMLSEGRTREEAAAQIELLLQLIGYFQGLDLQLTREAGWLNLGLTISLEK